MNAGVVIYERGRRDICTQAGQRTLWRLRSTTENGDLHMENGDLHMENGDLHMKNGDLLFESRAS